MAEASATVLVVDEERELADLYAAWLGNNYVTRVAYGGAEALESLDERVDVVLLDRRMPDITGDDVLAEMNDNGLECPVGVILAVEPDFDIVEMGVDDYLTKPVSQDELLDIVESLLGRKEYDEK